MTKIMSIFNSASALQVLVVRLIFGLIVFNVSVTNCGAAANDLIDLHSSASFFRQPEGPGEAGSGVRSAKHSSPSANVNVNCQLKESWNGKWFQSGIPSPIEIKNNKMTTKGDCVESRGDKFLFVESPNYGRSACYRCIVINDRHLNVLQYKESMYCEEKNSLENLCAQITGDAQLYSLFRVDAALEECPFRGAPFTFTYNRGYGECKNPVSHVDSCTDNSKLLLRYQACPDVVKTESLEEELHCIAQWRDGSQHYLVGKVHHRLPGSNEEIYRCFAYEKIKGHNAAGSHAGLPGYKVAQSGDATCTGVTSSSEGAKTLTLHRAEHSDIKCKFPGWLTAHHWHTLNGKLSARFHHKNATLHLTEDSRKNSSASQNSIQVGAHNYGRGSGGGVGGGGGSYLDTTWFSGDSRIFCQSRKDVSDRHSSILARHVNGCQTKSICMQIFKRDSHVVEVQIRARDDENDCGEKERDSEVNLFSATSPFVTLVSTEAAVHRCPYLGKYTATSVTQDGRGIRDGCGPGSSGQNSFNTLVVGCGDRAKMEFHSKCPSQEPTTTYSCHGHWEEDGLGFLIATPMSRSSTAAHRYCFVYTESAEGSLRVYSSSESCRRNIDSGTESSWAFNLTSDGQCAEAVTAGAAATSVVSCDTSIHNIICVIVVLIISLMSNTMSTNTNNSNSPTTTTTKTSARGNQSPCFSQQDGERENKSEERSKFQSQSSTPNSNPETPAPADPDPASNNNSPGESTASSPDQNESSGGGGSGEPQTPRSPFPKSITSSAISTNKASNYSNDLNSNSTRSSSRISVLNVPRALSLSRFSLQRL